MECLYYDAGRCRSCTLIKVPHAEQVASKQQALESLVTSSYATRPPHVEWLPPLISAQQGFRTKAKMVVGGSADAPTLGILDAAGAGIDLSDCPLYGPEMAAAFPVLARFITVARLEPYDVLSRKGELKNVIVTVSPQGELMVRFVCRSTEPLARIHKHAPWLEEALPSLVVVTLNVLPEHKAVLEGATEHLVTGREELRMDMGRVVLRARPQSFIQTNTDVARSLYAQVADWVDGAPADMVWDLYCGIGGFALHCAREGRRVVGVETSEQAVRSAADSAAEAGFTGVEFVAADATEWVVGRAAPDVVIVNPPRRGVGTALATWIEASGVRRVVYSSCNAVTLARDLASMPSLRPVRGRLLDMFPHTEHFEAVVLLERS